MSRNERFAKEIAIGEPAIIMLGCKLCHALVFDISMHVSAVHPQWDRA